MVTKNTIPARTEVPTTKYREVPATQTRPEVVHHYTHSSDGVLDTALKVGMVTSLMNSNRPAAPTNVRVESPTTASEKTTDPQDDTTFLEFIVNSAFAIIAGVFILCVGTTAVGAIRKKMSARR